LGIDTGGTYTDAALIDHDSGAVIAAAKALTTYQDLALGIEQAIAAVLRNHPAPPDEIGLVSLSTTLATNAIVEGRGSPICLILVGYDPILIRQFGFEDDLVTEDVVYVAGGHDDLGDEVAPLDEIALRKAVDAYSHQVEAFAVSAYFGVRNPAHELRARELIEAWTGLPVTCGHELTSRLNSVRRATTTALNARLISLLRDLIATVRETLDEQGVHAPLMVVRGDGSLMRSDWALRRPIETILSGPAASVVGAWHLARKGDVWVVDVGGTTTDIAALHDGRPRLNPQGARVGRWRTMVEAADVHTVGLGGDSEVRLERDEGLVIGPRRVVPLCLLAQEHPDVVRELERQQVTENMDGRVAQFAFMQREPAIRLSDEEHMLLDYLRTGAKSVAWLVDRLRYGSLIVRRLQGLERRRLVMRAGFTPTDALHALGLLNVWDRRAAELGAELLAARAGVSVQEFCEQVVRGVSDRVATELVSKVLSDEISVSDGAAADIVSANGSGPSDWIQERGVKALLDRALERTPASGLQCQLILDRPIVAIGAPVEAYLPRTADVLHTELVIAPHAGVANAVGAVAGGVVQQQRIMIRPLHGEEDYRLLLFDGVHDFLDLEAAVTYAHDVMAGELEERARQAGAAQVEVKMVRVDHEIPVTESWGQSVYMGTELFFTAVGRPSVGRPTGNRPVLGYNSAA